MKNTIPLPKPRADDEDYAVPPTDPTMAMIVSFQVISLITFHLIVSTLFVSAIRH